MTDDPKPRGSRRRGVLRGLARRLVVWTVLLTVMGTWFGMTGCMERLFYYPTREPTPVPTGFAGAEAVDFASADGTALHGWFVPAADRDPAAAATVLHVHGNAGNIADHFGFTDFLPPAGYNVFIFDYRGYGQSDGTPRRRDDLIADAHAALDAVLAREDTDSTRVVMFAQSLGGAIGLNLMADREEIGGAVIVSPFASWREIAADSVSPASSAGPIARLLARILIPDHRRPVDAASRIERPLLVIHGTLDGTVPVEHGRRIAQAAPNATYLELPDANHNDVRWVTAEFDRAVLAFFAVH